MRTQLQSTSTRSFLLGLVLFAGAAASTDAAAALTITRFTVDGGGTTSSSADFKLTGTVGQPEARPVAAANALRTLRGGFWPRAGAVVTAVETLSPLPAAFRLNPNVPNPFNPSTSIRFDVPRTARVLVEIYNLRGQRVRVLRDDVFPAGHHEATWNGQDSRGAPLSSGVYLVRVRAGESEARQKITLLK